MHKNKLVHLTLSTAVVKQGIDNISKIQVNRTPLDIDTLAMLVKNEALKQL